MYLIILALFLSSCSGTKVDLNPFDDGKVGIELEIDDILKHLLEEDENEKKPDDSKSPMDKSPVVKSKRLLRNYYDNP